MLVKLAWILIALVLGAAILVTLLTDGLLSALSLAVDRSV